MSNALIVKPEPIVAASATSVAPGHDPAYVGNDYAGVVWRTAQFGGAGSVDLVVDLGSDRPCDTVMLFGCEGVAAGTQLSVFASTTAQGPNFAGTIYASGAQALLAGSEMPIDGRGIALIRAPALVNARYWMLRITFPAATQISVARVVIGRDLKLERNFSFGGAFGVRDLGTLDFSARGVLLRRLGKKLRTLGLTFANVRKDEVEAMTTPLIERIGNTEMVALVTDPAAHPMRQRRSYYGPLVGDLGQIWKSTAGWEAKVNMVSIF